MPWIFGSFLVTACALTSCHVVISQQGYDCTIRALGYNRCVTGRIPRDENHEVWFRQWSEGHAADQRSSLTSLPGGASIGTPWLPEEDMVRRPLSTHLSRNTETLTLSKIKCEKYIFLKKFVRSFIEVINQCYDYSYTTVVSEFELQSCYYIHLWRNTTGKGMNPFYFPTIGKIVPLPFF